MSTETSTDDTDAIIEVAAAQRAMNDTLKAVAEEVGLSPRDLETGADPDEREADAEKAALFGAKKAAVEKADDDRPPAKVAADLLKQNTANIARIAEATGVSKRKITVDPGTSEVEAEKAALFTSDDAAAKAADVDDDERTAAHKHFYGSDGSPDREAGDGWSDADPDATAGDRQN
jgi:hypothetical protein